MFMLKAIVLVMMMFMTILFGMQVANNGIQNMKGFEDPNFKGALTVAEGKTGELQASILGNDVSSHDLQQKKEQLEEMNSYNFFSSMGKKLSTGIQLLMEQLVVFITDLIKGN